ncbi:MAG: hypothetical protein ACI9D0_001608 [Bacteroidia bacterium]|jgi:hypothetical protein
MFDEAVFEGWEAALEDLRAAFEDRGVRQPESSLNLLVELGLVDGATRLPCA